MSALLDSAVTGPQPAGRSLPLPPVLAPDRVADLLGLANADPGAPGSTDWAPFDGRAIAHIPHSRTEQVDAAFERARSAQPRWAALPVRERQRVLLRFHDLLLENLEDGLDLLQWETGKTRMDAFKELVGLCFVARYYARGSARLLRSDSRLGLLPVLTTVHVERRPVGVVGVIAPWNYPAYLASADALPALVAGNAVALMPDRQTSLCGLWTVELLRRAGVPADALQVVLGEGPVAGPQVVERSDFVVFTGSSAVGAQVGAQCGERLIGCSLELGGKNPMLVLEDADPERAAEIAVRACFDNAGQLCVGIERIYTVGRIHQPFLEHFLGRVAALRMVPGASWEGDYGSLISPAHRDRVDAAVRDAVAGGATVLAGGHALPEVGPCYYAPTVLTGVGEGMRIHREETFGPVVAVEPVSTVQEAVERANDSDYGLSASILTGDRRNGIRLARELRTGAVNVNEAYEAALGSPAAPMGGMRRSGLGRRNGDHGLLRFTEEQAIAVQRGLQVSGPSRVGQQDWATALKAGAHVLRRARLR